MFKGRKGHLPPQKTESTPFAAKAKDLGALRDTVVDAASVGTGLWISYLFALFYFAIAAGAVTHRDLLLESPVKLPFLNVELPLKAFFILGPLVFLIVHAYVLLHFVLLAGKIGAFHTELQAQISGDDTRARLRGQLPSNVFVQSLAGPREVRNGIVGFLLRLIIEISLVVGPIGLLILFQLQFLPYHSEWIASWQRIAVMIDLVLLWILWPRITRGETVGLGWRDFKQVKVQVLLLVSFLAALLVVTIATFPGEWLEEHLQSLPIVPTHWPTWRAESGQANNAVPKNRGFFTELELRIAAALASMGWTSPHEVLVAGEVDYVTGRPKSVWSNRLVLPNFEAGDRVNIDAEGKIATSSGTVSLRGRSLERAVLVNAHLKKVDFTGARLAGADFTRADLREAKFECALVGQRDEICAQLQGARLENAELQGASLRRARLQGASLADAHLQGAHLDDAELQGTSLDRTQMQGASLFSAHLQGARLFHTQLQGASLTTADLSGAWLDEAQLEGASLVSATLLVTSLHRVDLQGAWLNNTHLWNAILDQVFVWRAEPAPPTGEGTRVVEPELGPKYFGLDCYESTSPLASLGTPGEVDVSDLMAKVCTWSEKSYETLKSQIGNSVPAGRERTAALERIARLEKPPFVEDEALAKAWADLVKSSPPTGEFYYLVVAEQLKGIGCAAEGGPYVINALVLRPDPFLDSSPQAPAVAAAFLDDRSCPGARELSEEMKAKLRHMRDQGLPASPGPGAASHRF
jgi:uncharacterized protein YjbI with pentapeptide repeats